MCSLIMDNFGINDTILNEILKRYNSNKKSLDQSVGIIKTWLKTQKHLPEIMDEKRIRNFLIHNKLSIEVTKQKIDLYYSVRNIIPDWFTCANPKLEIQKQVNQTIDWLVVPAFINDIHRLVIFHVRDPKSVGQIYPQILTCYGLNLWEVRLCEDLMCGDYFIIDFKDVSLELLSKYTPAIIKKQLLLHEGIYSLRVKAVYVINSPAFLSPVLAIIKTLIKQKIFQRIHVFTDGPEILKNYLPPEILPVEYGGTGPTFDELRRFRDKYFEKYQTRFDELDTFKIDEHLRPEKLQNDEVLGFHGNFKKLDVD